MYVPLQSAQIVKTDQFEGQDEKQYFFSSLASLQQQGLQVEQKLQKSMLEQLREAGRQRGITF